MVDSHAGDASDQMTLRIKFVESKKTGVTDTALGSGSEWLISHAEEVAETARLVTGTVVATHITQTACGKTRRSGKTA